MMSLLTYSEPSILEQVILPLHFRNVMSLSKPRLRFHQRLSSSSGLGQASCSFPFAQGLTIEEGAIGTAWKHAATGQSSGATSLVDDDCHTILGISYHLGAYIIKKQLIDAIRLGVYDPAACSPISPDIIESSGWTTRSSCQAAVQQLKTLQLRIPFHLRKNQWPTAALLKTRPFGC